MASTDPVIETNETIFIGDIEANRPNSESINRKLAGNTNFVLNRLTKDEDFTIGGYFNANAVDDGSAGIRYIERNSEIVLYHLSMRSTGSSGTNSFNIAVYDSAGAFINNIFGAGGNALSVSGNSGTDVTVGRTDITTSGSNVLNINTAGHTVQNGLIQLTNNIIPAGSYLVPFVVSNGVNALNLHFKLRFKEQ